MINHRAWAGQVVLAYSGAVNPFVFAERQTEFRQKYV